MERRIHKTARAVEPAANLLDYERARAEHEWASVEARLDHLPGGRGLNIAHEAADRHARGGRADRVAIRWLGKTGAIEEITYRQLSERSSRFANALLALGLKSGDRVFALTGRTPALYVAALGTWKAGGIFSPLFSAFGPEPVRSRIAIGEGRFLLTTDALYDKKVAPIRAALPSLEHVILVGAGRTGPGLHRYDELLSSASSSYEIPPTPRESPALLHFTSGTTGTPKGALHVHGAVVMHDHTGRLALDLHEDDTLWCTADPGWVTGTSYGIIAPLVNGVTLIVDEAEFDVTRWYKTLAEQGVTVWYTAPTAIRMLMRAGAAAVPRDRLSRLRFMASVGEPLNPDAVIWSDDVFGRPFHDNYWQTETGGIVVANYLSMDVRPGSMGKPVPGIEAAIARRTDDGVQLIEAAGEEGELVLREGWPSMFRGYWGAPERYAKCFRDGWYFTGDLARRDEDGYFWFVARADDVIKTGGHLIGPFEVESVLLRHPAVAEAGVIGKPDPVFGDIIKAFVALKPGTDATEETQRSILGHARKELGPVVAPKELAFVSSLPRTRTGKVMRRLLRARELGLPEGDISTLEGGAT